MDKSLQLLCDALKRIFAQLKPQQTPLSFLLLIGKTGQGKTELLKQANLIHCPVDNEQGINLFYNNQGVILELSETWLCSSESLLTNTLKQLNRCHSNVKINGLILCVNSSELLLIEPAQLVDQCKSHMQLLDRFGSALGYCTDIALLLLNWTRSPVFVNFSIRTPQRPRQALGIFVGKYRYAEQVH